MSYPEIALVWALLAFASMVQAAFGFGLALIAAAPLLLIDPALVPGPILAASFGLSVLMATRDRAAIDLSGLGYALLGRIFGTIGAALFVGYASRSHFDFAFGTSVLLAVFLSWAGWKAAPTPAWAIGAGALSGLMATISSIGGPPMALLYQDQGAGRLRGTLAAFFTAGTVMSVLALTAVGNFAGEELWLSLVILPPVVLGFVVAAPLRRRLDDQWIRPAVLALSLFSALAVMWRALS